MSTTNDINGVRIQRASEGMLLKNGEGLFVKEIALGLMSNEWPEVVDDGSYNETIEVIEDMGGVPSSIGKLQAVALLVKTGKHELLMAELDKDTTGVSRILFEAASTLTRSSNMVNQLAGAINMSREETDQFFIEASQILI